MKRNLAIQILCSLFLLIGAGNICQAQELEGKFRIHCAVFVLFSSSCMHVCRPNGRKRRKENSLSHMPSQLRQWKKETICNHSIFRYDNFIGCFSADKIKMSVRK